MAKQVWGSIDTPLVDYVIPKWEIIEEELKKKGLSTQRASDIYDSIIDEIGKEVPAGSKFTIDKGHVKSLRSLTAELESIIAPCELSVQSTGGTGFNKLYYTKALLGDSIEAVMIGCVGDDKRGEVIKANMAAAGISMVNNGETIPYSRESLIIAPKGQDDRIVVKFPYKEPQFFRDIDKMIEQAKKCDVFYLESSLIKFWGKDNYIRFVNEVADSGTKIIFAPPTDRSFYISDKKNEIGKNDVLHDHVDAFAHAGKRAAMITMNDTEAVSYMGRPLVPDTLDDALQKIRRLIKKATDKLVIITAGADGMTGISNNFETKIAATSVKKIFNTIGAGDSAAATIASIVFGGEFRGFLKPIVERAMRAASQVSAAVISYNPAQIEREKVLEAAGKYAPSMAVTGI